MAARRALGQAAGLERLAVPSIAAAGSSDGIWCPSDGIGSQGLLAALALLTGSTSPKQAAGGIFRR
jgi:hypothetical protein